MIKTESKYFIFGPAKNYNIKYYIKYLISVLFDFFYNFVILFSSKKYATKKKYYTAICAIFKDESKNLDEWIEFHKIVGIEHFYMYNNFSNDNYKEILDKHIASGYLTLIEWPIKNGQFSAYENFYECYRNETSWVIFLDLDEFITPFENKSINQWISKFSKYPSVILYWKMFGSSGKINHDFDKLTIEQYSVCWKKMYNIGKSFINTNYEIAFFDSMVHHATTIKLKLFNKYILIPSVNEFKCFIKYDIHRVGFFNKSFTIQINHYWSKSYEYYINNKVQRGDVNNHERTIDTFYAHEIKNNAVDHKIFKYIILLKNKLKSFHPTVCNE